jgi:hypothetical protein
MPHKAQVVNTCPAIQINTYMQLVGVSIPERISVAWAMRVLSQAVQKCVLAYATYEITDAQRNMCIPDAGGTNG